MSCMRARERSAIVGVRIEILPEAPMTPAIAGHVPTSAPYARDEPSVSEEYLSLISMPTPPPLPPRPLGLETLHAGGSC